MIFVMEVFLFALLLSLLAGLSTTIGSVIALIVKKPNPKFISLSMGFSAGVMILIAFVELLPEAIKELDLLTGSLFFFLGMLIMFGIDVFISHEYEFEDSIEILTNDNGSCSPHPHHVLYHKKPRRKRHQGRQGLRRGYRDGKGDRPQDGRGRKDEINLVKTSIFTFLGVFIHNFPEGMATYIGAITEIQLGIILALAIALHNIPEGIAVAVPIYACTGNKKKAFKWSFLSGISEPLGAVVTWIVLTPFITPFLLSAMLAIVAGVMIYISLDELLPASRSLGYEHLSILGIIVGMFIMTLSLVIL
ncbi:MAG: zinc transporter ZupT [Candidatus Lokiarchaeota archaeon]|nr:zinc transporter ZupT [Candidatus Lokiarchaeota archaeon]